MLIFTLDDEPKMLRLLHRAIEAAEPAAEIMDFSFEEQLFDAIIKDGKRPDVVFMDIEMPGRNGLEIAVRLKQAVPGAGIIFVTGYSQYAVEAFRIHANGYIMKPADPEKIRQELDHLKASGTESGIDDKLQIHCFGWFDVFWKGEPVIFKRKQEKELLAYLVDRNGAACTNSEIIDALWEDEADEKALGSRLRTVLSDLRKSLAAIGMEDVLIREHRQTAIKRDLVDCDYYRMLDGDVDALNAYNGEYMKQYSWAEMTAGELYFRYGDDNSQS